jgi:hypothetical protein
MEIDFNLLSKNIQDKLLEASNKLFVKIINENTNEYSAQQISNTLYGLRFMNVKYNDLSQIFKNNIENSIKIVKNDFNEQGISNILLSFANMGFFWKVLSNDLQLTLLNILMSKINTFNDQSISNTINSLGKMEINFNLLSKSIQDKF